MNLDAVTRVMSRKQIRSIFECNARINLWHGAVSSGKTVASLMAFIRAVCVAPENGLIFVVGRTIDTINRNIMEPLQQTHGPFGPLARHIHYRAGANQATIFGRTVHLVGANDVQAEGRIRGATASLIYVDEATLIPQAFFVMSLSRLRVPGAKMLATTNPDGPHHWLRKDYLLREAELNLRSWHFTLDDNPWLAADYVNSLKTEYTGLFYRRFIEGRWVLAEGAVFDGWDPDVMVVDQVPPVREWIGVGVDYGTTNPFAGELLALGSDGRLYLADEYYYASKKHHRQLSDAEYADALKTWLDGVPIPGSEQAAVDRYTAPQPLRGVRPKYTVVDPSAASFRVALHKAGITSILGDNAVLDGVRVLGSLMATDRLRVSRRCKALIDELPSYSWNPKAAEKGEDAPLKVDDHAIDATRYITKTTQASWLSKLRAPVLRGQ